MKVVLIFDAGGRGDGGFKRIPLTAAWKKPQPAFGVKAVYVEYKRNLEQELAVNEAAASDAEMIIGVGFAFPDKLNKLAAKYPDGNSSRC
ncbi:MAG: hypothetical protein MZV70_43450 [Desulfobacterales bacterium]|nr:hypothetical protein [Desulfobacterales bacterium]